MSTDSLEWAPNKHRSLSARALLLARALHTTDRWDLEKWVQVTTFQRAHPEMFPADHWVKVTLGNHVWWMMQRSDGSGRTVRHPPPADEPLAAGVTMPLPGNPVWERFAELASEVLADPATSPATRKLLEEAELAGGFAFNAAYIKTAVASGLQNASREEAQRRLRASAQELWWRHSKATTDGRLAAGVGVMIAVLGCGLAPDSPPGLYGELLESLEATPTQPMPLAVAALRTALAAGQVARLQQLAMECRDRCRRHRDAATHATTLAGHLRKLYLAAVPAQQAEAIYDILAAEGPDSIRDVSSRQHAQAEETRIRVTMPQVIQVLDQEATHGGTETTSPEWWRQVQQCRKAYTEEGEAGLHGKIAEIVEQHLLYPKVYASRLRQAVTA